jgi:hypothetical protein
MLGRLIDPFSRYAAELQMRTIDQVFRKWEPSLRWQNSLWKLSIPGRKSPSGELEIYWGREGENLIAFIERVEREWADFCADYVEPVNDE